MNTPGEIPGPERPRLQADIVCVGFGPATGGFLTTLSRQLLREDGSPRFESAVLPGAPLQVLCYERADDLGFGVSGVVTRGRGIRATFPDLDLTQIPMAAPLTEERMVYLLDPVGASRRSAGVRWVDRFIRWFKPILRLRDHAFELPYVPGFLHKTGGFVLSVGQFNQWVGSQLLGTGTVQLWPGTPVAKALIRDERVVGIQLIDQGTDRRGQAEAGFMPGMEVEAALTVVGDGPVGAIGRQLDEHFALPAGHHQRDWALGMKMVVELRPDVALKPGAVLHTFGYPEPEIFGFLYVHTEGLASLGIFVPSWFDCPVRTVYRYLQHWMLHPYLWQHLRGGRLRSWGAKTLQEAGQEGEPWLVGEGYARIGEGSGSTNVLTGSGVDEAWTTGVLLAEGVLELLRKKEPFTRQNLQWAYVERRRASWLQREGQVAAKARIGFQQGVIAGILGMGMAAMTRGWIHWPGKSAPSWLRLPSLEAYYQGRIPAEELESLRQTCGAHASALHDRLMEHCGWPPIPYDGQLLVSHQDALLLGGKVQAAPGYADHIRFLDPQLCRVCAQRLCLEACSGQALTPGAGGVPAFDREKCVHCGACLWNCSRPVPGRGEQTNIALTAGVGGLHSAEN